jgi:hypothetical protein
MQTPYPEPVVQLAGTRRVLESAHKLMGATWGDEGTTRIQHAWTADPGLIRRLGTGQACYIHHGGATFVQVARPKPSPLTILPPPGQPVIQLPVPRDEPAPGPWQRPPPGSPPPACDLDDIFGPGAAR